MFAPLKTALEKVFRYWNVFPCPLCGGDGGGRNRFCPECLKKLAPLNNTTSHCRGCGGPLDGVLAQCSACLAEKQRPWQDALSLFAYRGEARELVHRFKFLDTPELATPLGELAAEKIKESGLKIELIVPIPLHFFRYAKRTYNQSQLLAQVIANHLHLPCRNELIRAKRGRRQSSLSAEKRRNNPKNAFLLHAGANILGRSILLVDDVFTTGSTLDAAARTLQRAKCGPIYVFTIARTPKF